MINISDFLEKFKKLDKDNSFQKQSLVEKIEKIVGIKLSTKEINIKAGVLYIQGSPTLKQEVFLKKQELLSALVGQGVSDIK